MLVKAGRWRLTDATLDRDRDVVYPEGADISNFIKNPILLYNHGSSGIGRVEDVKFEDGGWYGDLLVDPDAVDYNGKNILERTKLGTLNMVSIRFRTLNREDNKHGGLDIKEWELVEVSLVDIPANPNAEKVKSLKGEKYFVTNNGNKMKFSDLLSKYFGVKDDTSVEDAEAAIKKSLEAERVKETLKSYDEALKGHIATSLSKYDGQIEELLKSIADVKEENVGLKSQLNEIQGKAEKPKGEAFDGKDGDDEDEEEGIFDLVKFHEKNFGK